jgi:hypothetical protein
MWQGAVQNNTASAQQPKSPARHIAAKRQASRSTHAVLAVELGARQCPVLCVYRPSSPLIANKPI